MLQVRWVPGYFWQCSLDALQGLLHQGGVLQEEEGTDQPPHSQTLRRKQSTNAKQMYSSHKSNISWKTSWICYLTSSQIKLTDTVQSIAYAVMTTM